MKSVLGMFKKTVTVLSIMLFYRNGLAQDSSKFTFSGYAEVYYQFDFDNPLSHQRPFFIYNHKRHNEINLNLAYLKASYQSSKIRGNFALMAGNYAQNNLAAEPTMLQHVYEANIGVKISKNQQTWIDAGIFPSHIGFESAIATDCWTPGRSMVAENSPYFETGLKLTHINKKENLSLAFLLLNGWQRIQKPNGINKPSAGMQLNYKTKKNILFNYSNFIGSDRPDSMNSFRTYHNFYIIYEKGKKWGFTAGLDIGTDKNINNSYAAWYAPVLIARKSIGKKTVLAGRVEYFSDSRQAYIFTGRSGGFNVLGLSANVDVAVSQNCLWRTEARYFHSKDKIFKEESQQQNSNLLTTLSIKF